MLAKLSDLLQRYTKGWLIFLLLLLNGLFMGMILPMTRALLKDDTGRTGPIDLLLFYTPPRVYQMIAAYGPYGRAFYRKVELSVDIVYPVLYTLLLGLLLGWLLQRAFRAESAMQKLNVVPFGAWLFDLLENIGIVSMLSVHPSTPVLLAWLTALCTLLKWIFVGASAALILIALVLAIRNGFRRQAPASS
ncbi:MAG: hypothetical protein ACM3QS_01650 [Bacteroidota bacterium]